jgi:hypothetical protein
MLVFQYRVLIDTLNHFTQRFFLLFHLSMKGLQCREQRKKCRRSLQNDQCDRCIKRKVPCSFQYILSDRHKIFDVDSKESLQAFVQTLNTIESLEDQISNIEMQLKQKPRNQLEWHSSIANDKENSSKSNWELTIHSSNSQTLTLNVQVERTVGKALANLRLR